MSKSLTAGMNTHLAGRAHTRCWMYHFALADGTSIGFTSHNRTLTYDLFGDGDLAYAPTESLRQSDINTGIGFNTGSCELTLACTDTITLEEVTSGIFHRAQVFIFQVNWADLSQGEIEIMSGFVANVTPSLSQFTLDIRDNKDFFNMTIGALLTNRCRADYASGVGCLATPEFILGTVTSVTSELQFAVSFTGTYANDYFNLGKVDFLTGELASARPLSIFDWTSAGTIILRNPLPKLPLVGDTLNIYRGCPKTRPACKERGQMINFRGFTEVPTSDQIMKFQTPE